MPRYEREVINLRDRVPFVTLVSVVFGFAVAFADPPRVLLAVFAIHALSDALSGPAGWAWDRLHNRDP